MRTFSSYEELEKYCEEHADRIYVRAQKDGKWGSYSIAELPYPEVKRIILKWWEEKQFPIAATEAL